MRRSISLALRSLFHPTQLRQPIHTLMVITLIASSVFAALPVQPIFASNTPTPTSATLVGSLQGEIGCTGDWLPDCAASKLTYDAGDTVWQGTFTVPAGSYEYKVALNDAWTENYGVNAQLNGPNIPISLTTDSPVKFYYDHESHWITSNKTSVIAVAPGSFQKALGCPGDWQADCLRSWLQDIDGDSIYTFKTTSIPTGTYEAKVAINEAWDENYGANGAPGGANIPFTVANPGDEVSFAYDATSHAMTITTSSAPPPGPGYTVALVGSLQAALGCPGDWQPDCAATELAFDAGDDVWQQSFDLAAGSYEYKAALNDTWDVNYGANEQLNGPNIPLTHAGGAIKFYYDNKSHWITSNKTSVIAVAPGSFQKHWAALVIGKPTVCAPGCKMPMATASTPSSPPPFLPVATKAKWRSMKLGTKTMVPMAHPVAPIFPLLWPTLVILSPSPITPPAMS
ncbi:MAG: hypothetical protein U0175_23925 [Caldilineaceae bacterium]